MSIKTKWILRAVCTILCAFAVGFILYNAVQPAVESAAQSSRMVTMVQRAVAVFAPHSSIVTATGEEYRRLHEMIRTLAHFAEYALLGALGGWCCLSYTVKKRFFGLPMVGLTAVAVLDECLQYFTPGRSMQWMDLLVDVGGGTCGFAFSLFAVWLVVKIIKRRKHETG